MPTIKDWKAENERLLDDIEKYEDDSDVVNPYRLLTGIARVMIVGGGLMIPTNALIGKGLMFLGEFLKGYSQKRENK